MCDALDLLGDKQQYVIEQAGGRSKSSTAQREMLTGPSAPKRLKRWRTDLRAH